MKKDCSKKAVVKMIKKSEIKDKKEDAKMMKKVEKKDIMQDKKMMGNKIAKTKLKY